MPFKHEKQRKRAFLSSLWPRHGHAVEYITQFLDIFCGILFVIGSICFKSSQTWVVSLGDWLFIFASILSVLIAGHEIQETIHASSLADILFRAKDDQSKELSATILNGAAAMLYLVGCIFFMPGIYGDNEVAEYYGSEAGAWLCVAGSFGLAIAAFWGAIALGEERFQLGADDQIGKLSSRLSEYSLTCSLVGAVLFAVGSFMYRPTFGGVCNKQPGENIACEEVADYGTFLYLVGSVVFVVQSCISLSATVVRHNATSQDASGSLPNETTRLLLSKDGKLVQSNDAVHYCIASFDESAARAEPPRPSFGEASA